MRDREVQKFMLERYGLLVDCSNLTERQINMCLNIFPARKISDYPTLGEFSRAVFGKDTKRIPVATVEFEYFPPHTPVEHLQCPHFYQDLVRTALANAQESYEKLVAFKAQGRSALAIFRAQASNAMEELKEKHRLELVESEIRGYERGLRQVERCLKNKLLTEASAAREEIEENLSAYTDGIRIDLGECIELLEKAPDDRTSGAYVFIMELSKRFTKRLKVYSGRRPPDGSAV